MMQSKIWLSVAVCLFCLACNKDDDTTNGGQPIEQNPPPAPQLSSTMYADNGQMPKETGRYFGNASPDLKIDNPPEGTVEMVLTMQDKSNNNSWHWAVWDIPKSKTVINKKETWSGLNVTVGKNDYGSGYIGPFPPSEHEYVITVYFLKEDISLAAASYKSLADVMKDKIISQVTLTGRYKP